MNLSWTTLNNQELNQIMVQAKFEKNHLKPPDGAACFIHFQWFQRLWISNACNYKLCLQMKTVFCNITTKRKVTFKKWSCIKVKGVIHYHLKRQRADSQKKEKIALLGKSLQILPNYRHNCHVARYTNPNLHGSFYTA